MLSFLNFISSTFDVLVINFYIFVMVMNNFLCNREEYGVRSERKRELEFLEEVWRLT